MQGGDTTMGLANAKYLELCEREEAANAEFLELCNEWISTGD